MFIIRTVVVKDSSNIDLESVNGDILSLHLEGDCCSGSYFDDTSVLDVKDLKGERLMSVEEADWKCPDEVDGECKCSDGYETIQHSCLLIKTDRQSITMMWRNVSNGYYSGWLEVSVNGKEISRYSDDAKLKDFLV